MNKQQVRVLVVDDDDVDSEMVVRGFKKHRIGNPVTVAENGREALEVLRGNGEAPLAKPFIVLLDLNMPGMNGFEFLDELRSDPSLKSTVVFVLTTSRQEVDMAKSYEKNVAGYIVKGDVGPSFKKAVDMLEDYWTVVTLPR